MPEVFTEATLSALDAASHLAVAITSLFLYEYILTLDEEVEYFWFTPWTVSKALYFANRYMPACALTLMLLAYFTSDLTLQIIPIQLVLTLPPVHSRCDRITKVAFMLDVLGMIVVQGSLAIRAWHLFHRNMVARMLIITAFFVNAVVLAILSCLDLKDFRLLPGLTNTGCTILTPSGTWRIYALIFIFHVVLFLFTVFRAVKARSLHCAPFFQRLLLDGGIFYLTVLTSVGYAAIGAFSEDPAVHYPAIYSDFMPTLTSISISRLLFSIHSLAAELATDPTWLLNNVEMSRIRWKKGAHPGELFVEIDAVDGVDMHHIDEQRVCVNSGSAGSANSSAAAAPMVMDGIQELFAA